MIGLRTCAALGAVLLLAGCDGGDPTTAPPAPSPPTLALDHVAQIDGGPRYPDVYTGCLPGTSVRVFLGQAGYYSGLDVAAVVDTTCVQPLAGPGQ